MGFVGRLWGGGKPEGLYRFGAAGRATSVGPPETSRQTIVLEPVGFAAEIDGNRMLAVSGINARYIKGSRWVSSGQNLFAEALRSSFAAQASDLRLTDQQESDGTGYSLKVRIGRFEAQYDVPLMVSSPTIVMEGEATLYSLADRKAFAQRQFTARVPATQNRVSALVAAFDQAATCSADGIAGWVKRATGHLPPLPAAVCAPIPGQPAP